MRGMSALKWATVENNFESLGKENRKELRYEAGIAT
jgi:hypothetical protein